MSAGSGFSPELKAKAVLESLRADASQAELCRRYGIAPDQLSRWRQRLIEAAPKLFVRGNGNNPYLRRIAELEQLVGRLTLELEVSKKTLDISTSRRKRKETL